MPSNGTKSPATDSASTLRDLVGNDATTDFEDDPTFVTSNPTGNASSENLGATEEVDDDEDDDVDEEDVVDDEEDIEDDGLLDDDEDLDDDEEDEDDDDFDDDEEEEDDDATELPLRVEGLAGPAGSVQCRAMDDDAPDDDSGDDGRENAVDEDKLNEEEEDDADEVRTLRDGLAALPALLNERGMSACL